MKMLISGVGSWACAVVLAACNGGTNGPDTGSDAVPDDVVMVDTGLDVGTDAGMPMDVPQDVPAVDASAEFLAAQGVFTRGCALTGTGCHAPTGMAGGLVLTASVSYANTVGQPSTEVPSMTLVVPGDPTNSYLMQKVDGTFSTLSACAGARNPCGGRMPLIPASPLTSAQIATIRAWIVAGAPD